MVNLRITVWVTIAIAVVLAAPVRANDFVLENDEYKEVDSSYTRGDLWDNSTADVVEGGYINYAQVYDQSTIKVLNGGEIGRLIAYQSSTVDMSGGSIEYLFTSDLLYGVDRINIIGGTVKRIRVETFDLVGNQVFNFSSTVSDLASWGVQAAEGTVGTFLLGSFSAWDNSTVDISNGNMQTLGAYDSSTINISGGSISGGRAGGGHLLAYDSSTVNVSGGTMNKLLAYNSSTVDYSGGSLTEISSHDNSTIGISGGEISSLWARNNSTVEISGGSFGVVCYDGLWVYDSSTLGFSDGSVGRLRAHDSSSVEISGGSVNWLLTGGSSSVAISGGSVSGVLAEDGSSVAISGGNINWVDAYGSSFITIHGWDFDISGALEILETGELNGKGTLTGKWFDGTSWSMYINHNDTTATIMLVPEPTTVALLGLGGLALLKKRRSA